MHQLQKIIRQFFFLNQSIIAIHFYGIAWIGQEKILCLFQLFLITFVFGCLFLPKIATYRN